MKNYTADLVSGGEACIFLNSIIIPVLKVYDKNESFPFRWYGINLFPEKKLWEEFVDWELFKEETEKVIDYALHNKDIPYFKKSEERIKKAATDFQNVSYELTLRLSKLSDSELKQEYDTWNKTHFKVWSYGTVTFVYEMHAAELLDKSLMRYPGHRQIIQALIETDHKSFMIEAEEFLRHIRKNRKSKKFKDEFKKRFFYIKSNYYWGKSLTDEDIEEMLNEDFENNAAKKINITKVALTKREKAIVDVLKIAIPIRDYRKKINLIGSYTMSRFLEEISKRTKIEKEVLMNAFWHEIFEVFSDKTLAEKLRKRKQVSMVFDNGKEIYSEEVIIKVKGVRQRKEVLEGVSASVGKVSGKVRLIVGPANFSFFNKDEILVTFATRPEFMPVMKKAKAILTQEGGITSHAAIVARELGKPCIVGIKGLMESLTDGDLVEVDANHGRIIILKKKPKTK